MTKKIVFSLLASLCFPIAALAQSPAGQKHDLLLENFQLVDVETGNIRREQLLLIDGDRITAIVPSSERGSLSARSTIDLKGRYLIPGLWDMHVHFEGTDLIEDNALLLPVYLAYGITAVRDAASDLATEVLQWRGEVDRGVRPGPKIFTAGQKFEGIDSIWKGDLEVGDRKSMLEGMDKLEAMQVDFIKITDNTMEPGLFLETIKEARKRGHLVSAHVPVGATIEQLADAGLSSIEHASYVLRLGYAGEARIAAAVRSGEMSKQQANDAYKEGFDQELAKKGYRMLAKKGVAVTPTLIGEWQLAYLKETDHSKDSFQRFLTKDFMSKYQWRIDRMAGETAADREARKAHYLLTARQLPLLAEAGVTLLAGSDSAALNTYVYPAQALHEELMLFQQAGLTPLQSLQAATVNAAKFMGRWQDFGSVARGKSADLVVLEQNPLQDIRATQAIAAVICRGQFLDKAKLSDLLREAEKRRAELDRSRSGTGAGSPR